MQFLIGRLMVELLDALHLQLIAIFLESGQHTVICHLGCVRYEREHGVVDISVNCIKYLWHKLFAKAFALTIDVSVRTTAEVYALE